MCHNNTELALNKEIYEAYLKNKEQYCIFIQSMFIAITSSTNYLLVSTLFFLKKLPLLFEHLILGTVICIL